MAPIFGSHWLPGRGDRTIELGPGVPGFSEIWGDQMFSNLARPHRAPRIGLAVAAASVLVGTGGWVALSPPAEAVAALPTNCVQGTVGGAVTCTFGYTGGEQTFTVPAGVTSVTVTAWGGHGGDTYHDSVFGGHTQGGRGGLVSGTFEVTAGNVLTVTVGGDPTGPTGAYGHGIGGSSDDANGAGGGGGTAVADDSTLLVVAGGGGGGGLISTCTQRSVGGDAGQDGQAGALCVGGTVAAAPGRAGQAPTEDGTSATVGTGIRSSALGGGGGGGGYTGGTGGQGGMMTPNESHCCLGAAGGGGGTSFANAAGSALSIGLSERVMGENGLVTIAYTPVGPAAQLGISPETGTVQAGQGQAYQLVAYDADGASLADVTPASTLTISPDGSCTGATCTPASAGPHTVTATYGALVATASLDVTPPPLVYDFSGLLSPIDAAPVVNKAKAGSSVPVKFSLGADYGLDVLAEGSPSSRTVACDSGATADEVEQTVSTNKSGLTYDAASGIYTYVWKTDKKWGGSCRNLSVELADGSTQTVSFSFK